MKEIFKLLALLGLVVTVSTSDARPGGGHSSHSSHSSSHHSSSHSSWSHSTSSSHGSSHSSGGDLVESLIILLIIIAFIVYLNHKAKQAPTLLSSSPTVTNRSEEQLRIKQALETLKRDDPNFSAILFLDFANSLYHKFYSFAHRVEFTSLSPFLAPHLKKPAAGLSKQAIDEIVINGIRWLDIQVGTQENDTITLLFEANYSTHDASSRTRYTVSERWQFARHAGVKSLAPEKMHAVCCPYCGASVAFTDAGNCRHCGQLVETGAIQWYLANRSVLQATGLNNTDLVSYSQEEGTQLSTIYQLDLQVQGEAFAFLHNTTWTVFCQHFIQEIVKPYFLNIYRHWSERNWAGIRHLLSDRLYESNQFWLDMYHEQGYINRLDNLKIDNVQIVKVETDHYYEAITVRIFAACHDYTLNAQGKVIGGSAKILRRYSEYWTFVRYHHPESVQTDQAFNLETCPQCGAPADNMGQAAICGYCGSKISTGEFSWVLYRINQDEVYVG